MFIKLGELIEIGRIESADSCIPAINAEILENFKKFATNLKKIAPRAEDFLYFSAVMMHAAEASGYNDDGTHKLNARGEEVKVGWDKSGGTWRWESNDSSIKPYKNSNGDIFPEEELVKAYKKWIGKPLCIDHKSSSVDHVRGFIVDTYYDRSLKRVVALCALDKAGYPQLARQVSTGVSNCVSMGTAVGKAICTEAGCHRVARMEQDFCSHMKSKSGYGEINIDLNPIELSIVVNGADPKASIKHIIAAANTLNAYVETKTSEINKLADISYSATLTANDPNGEEFAAPQEFTVSGNNLNEFKDALDGAYAKLEDLKKSQENTNDMAFNQSPSTNVPAADSGLAPPTERYASTNGDEDTITKLHMITKTIEAKLGQMKESLDKLTNISTKNIQEETMSGTNDMNKKGYYQGAGGVNEPAPGQAKYPKDPLNEQLREKEDKQMVGQAPFPGVGPVDGMHPSPGSADPSDELERKKMLARAEAEERAIRRQAIVDLAKKALQDKKAYHQGGGGVNEPAEPGKVKYPADKLNEQLRDREDKQMVGQKPFPGVGAVDGMHPSPASADVPDEKKRKELLQRASLRARFVKAANSDGSQNLGKSAWEVFLGDKLLLTASVSELSGGRTEMLYESIATKDFGSKLIEKVKKEGADKVRSLFKTAQVPPPAPAAPAEEAPAGDEGEDKGKSGDPKENLLDLAEKARDLTSDVVEGVRALTGEQAEMGDIAESAPEMGAAASFSTSTLNSLRKGLNGALTQAMKECVAELNGHQQELTDIAALYDNGGVTQSNEEFVGSIAEDAMGEAKSAIADGFKLMTAFVKYARGTQAIVKRAEVEAELNALSEGDDMAAEVDSHSDDDLMNLIQEANDDLGDVKDLMSDETDAEDSIDTLNLDGEVADDNDLKAADLKPETQLDPKMITQASFDSKAGRSAMRAKLAADALGKQEDGEVQDMSKQKFSDMLDQADALADGQTQLDTKPSDDLGLVETLPEVNKAMMDLAKAPPKVRKEAEAIHNLVSTGKLDVSDLDALVAEGLDKDAVAYYKKYYGMVDGGSEFASELVKEHVKAQLEAEINGYKVKIARAYELAYDMVDRGMCHNDRSAVSSQVEEIMTFSDENFASLKKVVARNQPTLSKKAGRMTQFGVIGSGETTSEDVKDDFSQLSDAFAQKTKRLF